MPFIEESNAAVDVDISSTDFKLPGTLVYIHVGVGGTVILEGLEGNDHSFLNVASGDQIFGRWEAVVKTGTTATDMVAVYFSPLYQKG